MEIKVFKFGGASVKSAEAVLNVVEILKKFKTEKLVVIVSAMGKTTNALEQLTAAYFAKKGETDSKLAEIKKYHQEILSVLFSDKDHPVFQEINNLFVEIDWLLEEKQERSYDFVYDQLVSVGELLSSKIISAVLNNAGVINKWLDARDVICTDNHYREAKISWSLTQERVSEIIFPILDDTNIVLTQGFIGSTTENYTTTLGREGSDYSAAILAHCLDAKEMVIWKDVPGVLNADPKFFENTKMLDEVSYQDAIELAYYGASVIHPKTIQPLQNKNIPLRVKSFLSPSSAGTLISPEAKTETTIPSFIFKGNQALISISAKDFSFIVEENLSELFSKFAYHRIRVNMMQNSAISFSVCVDNDQEKLSRLINDLKPHYKILYNENLILYTIRHYDSSTIDKLTQGKTILVEQRSRQTIQLVVKSN